MAEIATLVLEVKSDGIQQATDSLDELTSSSKTVEKQTKSTTSSFNNVDKAAQKASGGFRAMKGATQQVSYQLQDIAVQAQSGTSAFIILGQQGPQLASIFGPGGAVLGAFIAFGAMIGGTLYNSMASAEVKTEELDDAIKRLDATVIKTKGNTHLLSKEILELARASSVAAIAELTSQLVDSNIVIDESKKGIEGFASAAMGVDFGQLPAMFAAVNDEASKFLDIPIGKQQRDLTYQVEQSLNKLKNDYKLGEEDAKEFFNTVSKLDSKDVNTYDNLGLLLDRLVISFGAAADKDLVNLRREVVDTANQMKLAADQAAILSEGIGLLSVGGANALAPLVDGTLEAAESFRDLENTHRNALLDMDQREIDLAMAKEKREDEAAQKKAAREKLFADRQLKTMQDGIDKRLAAALAADDTEIERVNNLLAQKLAALETDRMSSIMMADEKGQDTMAIEQKYQEATVALNYAAQGEIAAILENQRATDLEKQATYMSEWMRITSESMNNLDMLGFNMATSLQGNLAGAFEGFITGAKSAEESFKQFATGIAQSLVHALSNMAAQWAAYWIVEKIMGKTAQATAGTAMTFNALAGQQLAAINAFASTAAIPIFGPALAPAAAAGAIAATAPFVAATAALSTAATGARALGGQVRGGQSYLVGERGPELLTMGTSGRIATNENLKNAMGGGGVTVVNNVNASGSGPDVELKIRIAMEQTNAQTIATIQDLMRRRRFV